jgi:hypothetical protein
MFLPRELCDKKRKRTVENTALSPIGEKKNKIIWNDEVMRKTCMKLGKAK